MKTLIFVSYLLIGFLHKTYKPLIDDCKPWHTIHCFEWASKVFPYDFCESETEEIIELWRAVRCDFLFYPRLFDIVIFP